MADGYGLTLVTAPAQEPVTIAEAKKHVEVSISDTHHDAHLARLITAARQYVEDKTSRAICTQTWDLFTDELPYGDALYLPKAPLQSVTYFKYYDTSGVQQTWTNTNYVVSTSREPGRIRLAYGASWPSYQIRPDAINVRFVCGYGTQTSAPERVKAAILLLVGHWFEHRSEVHIGAGAVEVPMAAARLMEQFAVGDEFIAYGGP